jgi:regulation of enolase protein 1 (concanavalin A-like superfamily)
MSIQFSNLPGLAWLKEPASFQSTAKTLTITAPAKTDWFVDPNGSAHHDSAPALLFEAEKDFILSARVTVDFKSTYDAGVLAFYQHPKSWAKLCFERSPQGSPMIVSVVTKGTSDDCNSVPMTENTVYLRLAKIGKTCAFHSSTSGDFWHMVRYFALEDTPLKAGFLVQSPTGKSCKVKFSEVKFEYKTLEDIRSGE